MCPRASELLTVDGACGIQLGPEIKPREIETELSRAMPRSQQPHGVRQEGTSNEMRSLKQAACPRGINLHRLFGLAGYRTGEANRNDRVLTRRTLAVVRRKTGAISCFCGL